MIDPNGYEERDWDEDVPLPEEEISPYLEHLSEESQDDRASRARLDKMTALLENDPELRETAIPSARFMAALNRYVSFHSKDLAEEDPLDEVLDEACQEILDGLVTEELISELSVDLLEAFERLRGFDERCSVVAAMEFMRMREGPDGERRFSRNPFWVHLYWKTASKVLDVFDQIDAGDLDDREALEELFPGMFTDEGEAVDPAMADELMLETVKNFCEGADDGYFTECLPFHWFVRLPFSMSVLLGEDRDEIEGGEDQEALSAQVFHSAALQGIEQGILPELKNLCGRVLGCSPDAGVALTYGALDPLLDDTDVEHPLVLPVVYYEHYIHYLTNGSTAHPRLVQAIFETPRDPEVYARYAEALRRENEEDGAERVEDARREVMEWLKRD